MTRIKLGNAVALARGSRPLEEWEKGIEFLTRTGQMCDDKRQEFILLSDTLGASMLVDAINHRVPEGATETTVFGPFYVAAAPERPTFRAGCRTSRCSCQVGRVLRSMAACGSDRHAWHSDDDGKYDVQQLEKISDLTMRAACGQMNGHFHLWSIKPAAYPIPHDGPVGDMHTASPEKAPVAPAQVHFMIEAPGHEKLVTHVFVEGDEHIDCDVVFRVTDSLIRRFEQRPASVAPEGKRVDRPHRHLNYVFGLKPMGTCTGEHGHGIGTGNMALQTELGETMDLLRAVKLALDPQNIMYPRKIFRLEIER